MTPGPSTLTIIPPGDGAHHAAPFLFLVLSCDHPLAPSWRYCLDGVVTVAIGRGDETRAARSDGPDGDRLSVSVADPSMSKDHAMLVRIGPGWLVSDARSKNGTFINGEPVSRQPVSDGAVIELGRTFFLFREAVPVAPESTTAIVSSTATSRPAGLSTLAPPLEDHFRQLEHIARSTTSVMIHGETGTGKELVARAVHAMSRRKGRLVAVNCGALPANLVESMLFGHKKGAFSGAIKDEPGLVRSADGGTLFLDEIGDLPLPAQTGLLRLLQEGEVLPVGATESVRVDVRVVTATHRDLQQLVAAGTFRSDLYARLAGFAVTLPPLRERREDLGLIIAGLINRMAGPAATEVTFTREAVRQFFCYPWPLNIRELEKCLEAALALAPRRAIAEEYLPKVVRESTWAVPEAKPVAAPRPLSDEELRQRDQLVALLAKHGGNITAVSRALGKGRMQIHRWLKRYEIDLSLFRK